MKARTKNKFSSYLIGGLLTLAALITLLYFFNAEKKAPIMCTLEARAGLVLKIIDESGLPISGAIIKTEDLQKFDEFNGQYMGLYENPGAHSVTIEKDGFKPMTLPITLNKDVCHVIAKHITITLEK